MKYGIRATQEDGTVKYACSTTGKTVSLTTDITNIALFVQEKSAITAVKSARKNGAESKYNCVLDVVAIEFTVASAVAVSKPPAKKGWVILGDRGYCTGTQKNVSGFYDVYLKWHQYIESATVFACESTAESLLLEMQRIVQQEYERAKVELERIRTQRYAAHNSGWTSPLEQARQTVESREALATASFGWKVVAT